MNKIIGILVLLVMLNCQAAYANRGIIPFKPFVKIFEPTQRAMIAWNGKEEILLLSTDLKASEETKVLEVLPLPSEPIVKKGDVDVFKKATALINKKVRERRTFLPEGRSLKEIQEAPAGEVTLHEEIGAHDISVTRVLNPAGFIEWVEKYLRSSGVENPSIPEPMKTVVSEYLKEGFSWFVFDVVSLDLIPKTNEAIQYRFKTDFLFYPLKITRTGEGNTSIDVLVLTPMLLNQFSGIPANQVRLRHEPVFISAGELRTISEEMDDLLGHREDLKLRIWQIRGKLSSFDKDLIVKTDSSSLISGLPDLTVSNFELRPATPTEGLPVSIRISVSNKGTNHSGPFTVQWWSGENMDEPACSWRVNGLDAGKGRTHNCNYYYSREHEGMMVKAIIDSKKEVIENNEENNTKTMTISVRRGLQPQMK
jgi:hypothetical protein